MSKINGQGDSEDTGEHDVQDLRRGLNGGTSEDDSVTHALMGMVDSGELKFAWDEEQQDFVFWHAEPEEVDEPAVALPCPIAEPVQIGTQPERRRRRAKPARLSLARNSLVVMVAAVSAPFIVANMPAQAVRLPSPGLGGGDPSNPQPEPTDTRVQLGQTVADVSPSRIASKPTKPVTVPSPSPSATAPSTSTTPPASPSPSPSTTPPDDIQPTGPSEEPPTEPDEPVHPIQPGQPDQPIQPEKPGRPGGGGHHGGGKHHRPHQGKHRGPAGDENGTRPHKPKHARQQPEQDGNRMGGDGERVQVSVESVLGI